MLIWAKLVSGFLSVVGWFQRRVEADRNIQTGRDQRDAETLVKIEEGRKAREFVSSDTEHAKLLLKELGFGHPLPAADDDRQLLSQLRSRVSEDHGSSNYGEGYIAELRNIPEAVYQYSHNSLGKLSTCQYELQLIGLELSKTRDVTVVCGRRSIAEQQIAYDSGASKLPPGKSKHNRFPSDAVDLVPAEAPALWAKGKDLPASEYYKFAKEVLTIARVNGISLRWGGDWDGDGDFADQSFNDFSHFERV